MVFSLLGGIPVSPSKHTTTSYIEKIIYKKKNIQTFVFSFAHCIDFNPSFLDIFFCGSGEINETLFSGRGKSYYKHTTDYYVLKKEKNNQTFMAYTHIILSHFYLFFFFKKPTKTKYVHIFIYTYILLLKIDQTKKNNLYLEEMQVVEVVDSILVRVFCLGGLALREIGGVSTLWDIVVETCNVASYSNCQMKWLCIVFFGRSRAFIKYLFGKLHSQYFHCVWVASHPHHEEF
ncbi:hypothetical protein RFI_40031, partial [Reticulomyxa filosa]